MKRGDSSIQEDRVRTQHNYYVNEAKLKQRQSRKYLGTLITENGTGVTTEVDRQNQNTKIRSLFTSKRIFMRKKKNSNATRSPF